MAKKPVTVAKTDEVVKAAQQFDPPLTMEEQVAIANGTKTADQVREDRELAKLGGAALTDGEGKAHATITDTTGDKPTHHSTKLETGVFNMRSPPPEPEQRVQGTGPKVAPEQDDIEKFKAMGYELVHTEVLAQLEKDKEVLHEQNSELTRQVHRMGGGAKSDAERARAVGRDMGHARRMERVPQAGKFPQRTEDMPTVDDMNADTEQTPKVADASQPVNVEGHKLPEKQP